MKEWSGGARAVDGEERWVGGVSAALQIDPQLGSSRVELPILREPHLYMHE